MALSWKPVAGATSYIFYPSGGGAPIETADTSLALTGLTPNTAYGGELRAKNGNCAGSSSFAGIYTLAATPLDFHTQQVDISSMTVAWDAGGNPAGTNYLISRSRRQGAPAEFSTTGTSAVLTGLAPNTAYSITIRARNAARVDSAPASLQATTNGRAANAPAVSAPAAAPAPKPAPKAAAATAAEDAAPKVHIARDGDTLWSLAEKYYGNGHLWVRILKANPLLKNGGNALPPGLHLVIPAPNSRLSQK